MKKLGVMSVLLFALVATAAAAETVPADVGPQFQSIGPLTFGPGGVLFAADIDPQAVDAARSAAQANALSGAIHTCAGDGFRAPAVRAGRPYDLICANILAGPLVRMAPDLARHLTPGGWALLSGLLAHQEPWVLGAYRQARLRLAHRIALGEWTTLMLTR